MGSPENQQRSRRRIVRATPGELRHHSTQEKKIYQNPRKSRKSNIIFKIGSLERAYGNADVVEERMIGGGREMMVVVRVLRRERGGGRSRGGSGRRGGEDVFVGEVKKVIDSK